MGRSPLIFPALTKGKLMGRTPLLSLREMMSRRPLITFPLKEVQVYHPISSPLPLSNGTNASPPFHPPPALAGCVINGQHFFFFDILGKILCSYFRFYSLCFALLVNT